MRKITYRTHYWLDISTTNVIKIEIMRIKDIGQGVQSLLIF